MSTYDTFKMYMRMFQQEVETAGSETQNRFRAAFGWGSPKLLVKKLHPDAIIPTRGTPVAAGLDLYALEDGGILGKDAYYGADRAMVSTGIAIAVPPGYEGQVRPRSGLAAKFGISVTNSPGTIDEDYRGEVKVLLVNHGESPFGWKKGDRIAQLVITRANYFDAVEVEELDTTDRGANGFGSTGK